MAVNPKSDPCAAVLPRPAAPQPARIACLGGLQGAPAPLSILLPWPISTNQMWRAVRMGREKVATILSARARDWKREAAAMLSQQSPRSFKGPVELLIELAAPTRRAFDLDNRVKIVLDLLVACAVIEADDMRCVKKITVGLGEGFTGALVTVSAWEGRDGE